MRTKVRRWGNSLAIRIPRSLAEELALAESADVELRAEQGRLVVLPTRQWTLDELVEGINAENQHGEMDWGPPVGRERV